MTTRLLGHGGSWFLRVMYMPVSHTRLLVPRKAMRYSTVIVELPVLLLPVTAKERRRQREGRGEPENERKGKGKAKERQRKGKGKAKERQRKGEGKTEKDRGNRTSSRGAPVSWSCRLEDLRQVNDDQVAHHAYANQPLYIRHAHQRLLLNPQVALAGCGRKPAVAVARPKLL